MICDRCAQRQATIYLTKVVNGNKTELHLCKQCAEQGDSEFFKDMSLVNILANLANAQNKPAAPASPPAVCPDCGFDLERFRREGRLGCEQCYRQFGYDLMPMMRKIHGSLQHTGKRPGALCKPPQERKKPGRLEALRLQLKMAVKAEDYEKAAALRDEIRTLESAADGASK